MPSKKKKQPPTKPKCTLSSRFGPTEDLDLCRPTVICVPSPKQANETSPTGSASCFCGEDVVSTPVTCCAFDPQCEESSRSQPAQEPTIPTCVPTSQATAEVEAMIDEIRNCREIIRALALEAIDILHPETSQQNFQASQQGPIPKRRLSCCEPCDDSEADPIEPASQVKPIDRQKSDCSRKKCEFSEPGKYSDLEEQPTTRSFPVPPTQTRSPILSKKSSGPIAQNACQIKDKRLGVKTRDIDCSCDETINKTALGKKPSNCGCNGEKKNKADCTCDKKLEIKTDSFIMKIFGNKPSECSCDGEKKPNIDCSCDENKLGKKENCGCDGETNKTANCKCDETMKKQNEENERRENKTDTKNCLQKTFGFIRCDTSPIDSLKEKCKTATVTKACDIPKCAANTCTCHFPPAYSQYFDCTGHVSGNCHCDRNA